MIFVDCSMDQDQKHRCKFCLKTFPSGRSLGGHMRCHVTSPAAANVEEKLKAAGYGLRENPKKTARFDDLKEKRCRDRGKEFQSCKALFCNLSCHSEKIARSAVLEDEGSWGDDGSHIDGAIAATVPRKKRISRRAAGSSSSASEYSKEQEDVAISLMMLSRDVGLWGNGFSSFAESSDKNSFVSDGIDSKLGIDKSERRRSKYECITCNKSFNTNQPLGCHRASHKRMGGCFADAPIDQFVGNHQCLICGKVFGSGQALGGHKRSHLVMASPSVVTQQDEDEEEELIDLNLPHAEYNSWWAGSNLQNEAMLGMIAN